MPKSRIRSRKRKRRRRYKSSLGARPLDREAERLKRAVISTYQFFGSFPTLQEAALMLPANHGMLFSVASDSEGVGMEGIPWIGSTLKIAETMMAIHAETQHYYREIAIPRFLYRGVEQDIEYAQPIESWTSDPAVARLFARLFAGGSGSIYRAAIPAAAILISYESHANFLKYQSEFVVIGGFLDYQNLVKRVCDTIQRS